MKYNHAVVIAFSINSDNNADSVTKDELLAGMTKRVALLQESFEPEAFDVFDTYENGDGIDEVPNGPPNGGNTPPGRNSNIGKGDVHDQT